MVPSPIATCARMSKFVAMVGCLSTLILIAFDGVPASGQEPRKNAAGLYELKAANMTLVTDVPIDDELRRWPEYLEQSMVQWRQWFAPSNTKLQGLRPTVYLVGDKKRWLDAGLLQKVPNLQDGYQLGDDLYVVEQPSTYYRRLLFLHEATHWIMYRWQGGAGSPWLMEGMADMLGTHRFDQGKVSLGFFPQSSSQVHGWGRFGLIQDSLAANAAPRLSEIVGFREMQTDRMPRYAWSWAACSFLTSHPETREDFQSLYRGPLTYGMEASDTFYRSMESQWNGLSIRWRAFVDDLDFAMDRERSALLLNAVEWDQFAKLPIRTISIDADRGWQVACAPVPAGAKIRLESSGRVVVRSFSNRSSDPSTSTSSTIPNNSVPPSDWESEPQGVTVEYYRRNPLGCLVGTWVAIDEEQPTKLFERFRVGTGIDLPVPDRKSLLLLRVNEASSGLSDNRGSYTATLTLQPSSVHGDR